MFRILKEKILSEEEKSTEKKEEKPAKKDSEQEAEQELTPEQEKEQEFILSIAQQLQTVTPQEIKTSLVTNNELTASQADQYINAAAQQLQSQGITPLEQLELIDPLTLSEDQKNVFKKVKLYVDNPMNMPPAMIPQAYAFSIIYLKNQAIDFRGGWIIWMNDTDEEFIYGMDGQFYRVNSSEHTKEKEETEIEAEQDKAAKEIINKATQNGTATVETEKEVKEHLDFVSNYNLLKELIPEDKNLISFTKEKDKYVVECILKENTINFLKIGFNIEKIVKNKNHNKVKIYCERKKLS